MKRSWQIEEVVKQLANYEEKINFNKPIFIDENFHNYLHYYQLLFPDIDYYFGVLTVKSSTIMMQVYAPKNCIGTIFLLHGYFDHVGTLKHLISFLIEKNYRVVTYDLQGHGLSSGESAVIHSFNEYVEILEAVIAKVKQKYPSPYYMIAHSTGGAIVIDYLLRNKNHGMNKVILAAPLVRSHLWPLTKIGFYIINPFINEVKRKYRKNSSNTMHLRFVKSDPLQYDYIPLKWLRALIKWNDGVQTYSTSNTSLFIIQGERDRTVEWKYNIQFIADKFPKTILSLIEEGRHQLFNEREDIRKRVFHLIDMYLNTEFKYSIYVRK